MAFFTNDFLAKRREELRRSVVRVQYQINGSTWSDGTVNSKEVTGKSVVLFVMVPGSGSADTITGIRIYDGSGLCAGTQTVSLKRSGLNSTLLRLTFLLMEDEEMEETITAEDIASNAEIEAALQELFGI